jgi:hypothetical protein
VGFHASYAGFMLFRKLTILSFACQDVSWRFLKRLKISDYNDYGTITVIKND